MAGAAGTSEGADDAESVEGLVEGAAEADTVAARVVGIALILKETVVVGVGGFVIGAGVCERELLFVADCVAEYVEDVDAVDVDVEEAVMVTEIERAFVVGAGVLDSELLLVAK